MSLDDVEGEGVFENLEIPILDFVFLEIYVVKTECKWKGSTSADPSRESSTYHFMIIFKFSNAIKQRIVGD